MKKAKSNQSIPAYVRVLSVSNGTPEYYIGRLGTVTDETRGVTSVIFDDGKTQCFTVNELEVA